MNNPIVASEFFKVLKFDDELQFVKQVEQFLQATEKLNFQDNYFYAFHYDRRNGGFKELEIQKIESTKKWFEDSFISIYKRFFVFKKNGELFFYIQGLFVKKSFHFSSGQFKIHFFEDKEYLKQYVSI